MLSKLREFVWLTRFGPSFGMSAKNVQIINEPSVYYETLNKLALQSKHRIVLAALYLGTGDREKKLVQNLRNALNGENSQNLKLTVLMDYTRGSRGEHSSRTMLTPIIKDFGSEKVQVALYHSPKLRGLLRWLLPPKYNEIVGLQHMKVYIFDDNVIISGANLSDQYFDKRQDRYVLFKNAADLADYYSSLIETVSDFSFQLRADNKLSLIDPVEFHPYRTNFGKFLKNVNSRLQKFIKPTAFVNEDDDTIVFPLIQMGQLELGNDQKVTSRLLETFGEESSVKLATGYFNITPQYEDIIEKSPANFEILTAHPKANSFFGAVKPLGFIPDMYTFLLRLFFDKTRSLRQRLSLWEYQRKDWTFHGKGLWYYPPNVSTPTLTLIGSPNFGYRSVFRDLESQVLIYTANPDLQSALHAEQRRLFDASEKVSQETFDDPQRAIPWWIPTFSRLTRSYF